MGIKYDFLRDFEGIFFYVWIDKVNYSGKYYLFG